MEMQKVESSNVLEIGHDGKETMRVLYAGKGRMENCLYEFEEVSTDDFDKLQKAKSVGSHLYRMGVKGVKIQKED